MEPPFKLKRNMRHVITSQDLRFVKYIAGRDGYIKDFDKSEDEDFKSYETEFVPVGTRLEITSFDHTNGKITVLKDGIPYRTVDNRFFAPDTIATATRVRDYIQALREFEVAERKLKTTKSILQSGLNMEDF